MFNLIIAVVSIALLAAVLSAGSNHVDFNKIKGLGDIVEIESALMQVRGSVTTYWLIEGERPNQWSDIVPSLMAEPTLPENFHWGPDGSQELVNSSDSLSVFLGGEITQSNYATLLDIKRKLSDDEIKILQNCTDSDEFTPSSFPAKTCLKYIIN